MVSPMSDMPEEKKEFTWHRGHFVWRELFTPDIDRAAAFYTQLLGWEVKKQTRVPGLDYLLLLNDGEAVAGFMSLRALRAPNAPPAWLSYVSVEDVKGALDACLANGGMSPTGFMDMAAGTIMSTLVDPTGGAVIAAHLFEGDPEPKDKPPVGAFCWDQLATPKPGAIAPYYQKVCGWKLDGDLFKAGDAPVASLVKVPDNVPGHWLAFVVVEHLDESRTQAEKLGGSIVVPAIQVPGMGQFCVIKDDQGANLALFEPGPNTPA
jgi:predicted enzyme related to lactoylglutathione lyase